MEPNISLEAQFRGRQAFRQVHILNINLRAAFQLLDKFLLGAKKLEHLLFVMGIDKLAIVFTMLIDHLCLVRVPEDGRFLVTSLHGFLGGPRAF